MSQAVRVLIADKMDPKAAAIFRQRGIDVHEKPGLSPDELQAILGDYDGVAVEARPGSPLPRWTLRYRA